MRRRASPRPDVFASSLATISAAVRDILAPASIANRDGLLQCVNPMVKLAGIVALVIVAVVSDAIVPLVVLFVLSLGLAVASKVPLRTHMSRVGFIATMSLVVSAPQAIMLPGDPIITVFDVSVTDAGSMHVVVFTARAATSIALFSLLALTTPFTTLLAIVRRLPIPVTITLLMAVTYRYLLLFFTELSRMLLTYKSRTFRPKSFRETWRAASRLLGTFFLRTIERSERVHLAAKARGGSTPPRPFDREFGFGPVDALFVGIVVTAVSIKVVFTWPIQ